MQWNQTTKIKNIESPGIFYRKVKILEFAA